MNNTCTVIKTSIPNGEAAVSGLLAGIIAGAVMLVVLTGFGMFNNLHPVETLGQFDPSGNHSPMSGVLAHFSISAVYGAIFGLLWKLTYPFRLPDWVFGMIFGAVLYLSANFVLVQSGSLFLSQIPRHLSIGAHLVYGLALGLGIQPLLRQE